MREPVTKGFSGEPDAGNPHVRFDEGTVSRGLFRCFPSYSTGPRPFPQSPLLKINPGTM